jgi:hypothetical protein
MGKVTYHGPVRSSDDIPQPVGIVMGSNLRRSPDAAAKQKQPRSEPKKQPKKRK